MRTVLMNGNTPYAGVPGVVDAGQADPVELTAEQKDSLRRALAGIVARTESHLPEGYAVGSELSAGAAGTQATVSVQPPVGRPISAGVTPDLEAGDAGLSDEDRAEIARDLAAGAALQVMSVVGDEVTPTAR